MKNIWKLVENIKQLLEHTVNNKFQGPQLVSGLFNVLLNISIIVISHFLAWNSLLVIFSPLRHFICLSFFSFLHILTHQSSKWGVHTSGVREDFSGVPMNMGNIMAIKFSILNFHIVTSLLQKPYSYFLSLSNRKAYLFTHFEAFKGALYCSTE